MLSYFFNSHKDILLIPIFFLLPQFDLLVIEHLLFLIFWEFEYTQQGKGDVETGRITVYPVGQVELLHKGVDAVPDMHEVWF
jgi:hypothetical protein